MAALTTEQQIEAGSLYKAGLSVQEVADHFDVSLNAAFYAMRKQQVPRRTSAQTNAIRFEKQPLSYVIKKESNSAGRGSEIGCNYAILGRGI